jgi:hypothetical protein
VFRPSSRRASPDPFAVLGLDADADVAAIHEARRTLAKRCHPDAGGSLAAMQRLNAAVEAALAAVVARTSGGSGVESGSSRPRHRPTPSARGGIRRDHPSFTIEALPVEAFEGLLVAAAELGELADDDPPYLLEVVMAAPAAWCRLELVPDAGASTVSVTTARIPGHPTPDVYDVRDAWIEVLNRLDWSDPDAPPTP